MQTTLINSGTDTYQTKLVPFLFYAKGRGISDDLDKVIDYRYKYSKNGATYDSENYDGYGSHYAVCFKSLNENSENEILQDKCACFFFLIDNQSNFATFGGP